MIIRVSPEHGLPIYLQIVNQMKYLIASGRMAPGDEVPSIRVLAEQLLVNPNTVARAYRELESAGLIVTRIGAGTRVAGMVSPLARRERLRILRENVDTLLAEARQLGFDMDTIIEMVRKRGLETHPETEEES